MHNKKVLAIIPARGGSKRLPRKNILPLAGKPLIGWTIDAAVKSQIFDEVMVNTDDDEIATAALGFGAEVPFIRPPDLAGDTASSIDVLIHTVQWYSRNGIEFTHFALLQPTSPFRTATDIINTWHLMLKTDAESIVSVCEVEHPVQWTYSLDDLSVMTSLFEDNGKRSQDYGKNYRLNGAIYLMKIDSLLDHKRLVTNNTTVGYVMEREASIDIDCHLDFKFAEFIIGNK